MKRNEIILIITIIFIYLLIPSVCAFSYSLSIRTQNTWDPWTSSITSYNYGVQPQGYTGQMMVSGNYISPAYDNSYGYSRQIVISPKKYGGIFMGQCWDPYMCDYAFFANDTQIAEVSGTWQTDLIGTMNIMLTGDDTIRGIYEVDGIKGYLEGNFTTNETQSMEGLWWEEPSYQPPMSAGIITMTFVNETYLEGTYSYPDGMWGLFTASKIAGNLNPEIEERLKDMPEISWDVNVTEEKEYRVSNEPEANPVLIPVNEG